MLIISKLQKRSIFVYHEINGAKYDSLSLT